MTNKQPERSVEEIYEEYRKKFLLATNPETEDGLQLYCSRCSGDESFHTWLTQTLQAERQRCDEMERIRSMNYATKCLEAGTLLLYDVALTQPNNK